MTRGLDPVDAPVTWGEMLDTLRRIAAGYESSADTLAEVNPASVERLRRTAKVVDRAANIILSVQINLDKVEPILRGEHRRRTGFGG